MTSLNNVVGPWSFALSFLQSRAEAILQKKLTIKTTISLTFLFWASLTLRLNYCNQTIHVATSILNLETCTILFQCIQAALVFRALFICGFAYARSKNCLFQRTNPSISALYRSFYSRIRNSQSSISRSYLPRITRETCNPFNGYAYSARKIATKSQQ